jgi:glycosyltransferase involved in cell wall biosynthesis
MTDRHRVVMIATSYPRFPGDTVGTFMEPIARGLAARGHQIHMVLPWHSRWARGEADGGVRFHLYKYAPVAGLSVFGYAGALEADERLRGAALAAAPLALLAGCRAARAVARRVGATLVHGHWVIPSGAVAAAVAGRRPLVISLHGSDVFVAERYRLAGAAARWALGRAGSITACSDDLRRRAIALGARGEATCTVAYGVDTGRFRPDAAVRARLRAAWQVADGDPVIFAAGRFVRKKGFEYLIDAVARLSATRPRLRLVLAGGGDLRQEYEDRIARAQLTGQVILPGVLGQDAVADGLAASDVAAVPSVRDRSGNVDGLPNVVLEALASGTPVVASPAGGIGSVVADGVTGLLVPEADPARLAAAIESLIDSPARAAALGAAGRQWAQREGSWQHAIDGFERAYQSASRRNADG